MEKLNIRHKLSEMHASGGAYWNRAYFYDLFLMEISDKINELIDNYEEISNNRGESPTVDKT
jgi:hypothetical protein